MPETAQEHDDDKIDRGPRPSDSITAERKVEVIARESGKRNVPASPEIGEADGRVGKSEIIFQMEAEAEGCADRARRIAGKVEKDMAGKGDDAHPEVEPEEGSTAAEYSDHRTGEHGVGQDDLFKQAQGHERQAPKE